MIYINKNVNGIVKIIYSVEQVDITYLPLLLCIEYWLESLGKMVVLDTESFITVFVVGVVLVLLHIAEALVFWILAPKLFSSTDNVKLIFSGFVGASSIATGGRATWWEYSGWFFSVKSISWWLFKFEFPARWVRRVVCLLELHIGLKMGKKIVS